MSTMHWAQFNNGEPDELLSDLADTRARLDMALRAGMEERERMKRSCVALARTLRIVRYNQGSLMSFEVHHDPPADQALEQIKLLTRRETEVLKLIAEGLSTKEIATRLKVSFKTAVSHRTHLLQKLGMHESASLVRLAIHAGIVTP